MSKKKTENSLEDFSFDDNVEFFGVNSQGIVLGNTDQNDATNSRKTQNQGKKDFESEDYNEEDEYEDDFPDDTEFFGQNKKPKKEVVKNTKKSVEKNEEDEDDEEEDLEDSQQEDQQEEEEEEEDKKPSKRGRKKEPKFFEEDSDENSEDQEDQEKEKEFFTNLALDLKTKGVFNLDISENETLDEDEFFKKIDEEVENRVEETINALFEEMDEDAKKFIKFKQKGGNTSDFLAVYSTPLGIKNFDKKNNNHVGHILNVYLSQVEGKDQEEIADMIDYLTTSGKAASTAEKYNNKLLQFEERKKEELIKKQEEQLENKRREIEEFNKTLSEELDKIKDLGAFSLTEKDKKSIKNSLLKPTVKVKGNKFIPKFQAQLSEILQSKTPEARKKLYILAKIFEDNFEFDFIKNEVQNKVTKNIKLKIKQAKEGAIIKTGAPSRAKKSIADYFD